MLRGFTAYCLQQVSPEFTIGVMGVWASVDTIFPPFFSASEQFLADLFSDRPFQIIDNLEVSLAVFNSQYLILDF